MSKVCIAGDALVVTSSMKMEDLKNIAKYRPAALTLMGGEDNKEPVFKIFIKENGDGSLNNKGVVFTGVTHDDDKFATATLCARGVTGTLNDWIADNFGAGIIALNKLEAQLPAVLAEIAAEKALVLESITVIQ